MNVTFILEICVLISISSLFSDNSIGTDKVRMYEEIMTNDDNLESSLPTSSLLKCVLWYKLNCVFTAQWQEMN